MPAVSDNKQWRLLIEKIPSPSFHNCRVLFALVNKQIIFQFHRSINDEEFQTRNYETHAEI